MKFHHIGFATQNIEASITEFEALGHKLSSEIIEDPLQGVKLCFLQLVDESFIELVAPNSENSPVNKYLSKNGNIPYHFCYEVENMEESIQYFKKRKYIPITKPTPAVAFDNRLICFLYQKNVGLIELLEK